MRNPRRIPLLTLTAVLLLAGCGGGQHAKTVTVKQPNGRTATAQQPSSSSGQLRYQTPLGPAAHSPTFGLPPSGQAKPVPFPRTAALPPTVEMLDSVTATAIPAGAQAVAGYTSGLFPDYDALVARFPRAFHVSIAIAFSVQTHNGRAIRCLDVEPGDAAASSAGPWDKIELAKGEIPCDYASLSNMGAVKASIAAAGIPRSKVFLWDANWTFTPHLDFGYDATQYTDRWHGLNVDGSTVTTNFARGSVQPPPPPRLICFGAKGHNRKPECVKLRNQAVSADHAASSSLRAFEARDCDGILHRERWFHDHLNRPPKSRHAFRERAYRSSVAAYKRNSCKVFAGRVQFFNAKAAKIRRQYGT